MNISDWVRSCARGTLVFGMLVGYAYAQDTNSIPAGKKPNVVAAPAGSEYQELEFSESLKGTTEAKQEEER